jgi:arylformamidase
MRGKKMKIIDISQELLSAAVYEGDPTPRIDSIQSMEKGDLYNLSSLSMCLHNGTHIDAPSHFMEDGKTVEEIPLSAFVGECYVREHRGDISANDAREILKMARAHGAGERILLKGDLTVTEEAAKVFAEGDILLLGNEGQTVGPADAPMAVHKCLLGAEVVLLEGLVLSHVSGGCYTLCAVPLNIAGCEGAPCRAVLIGEA